MPDPAFFLVMAMGNPHDDTGLDYQSTPLAIVGKRGNSWKLFMYVYIYISLSLPLSPINISYLTQMLHVWNIYLHLAIFGPNAGRYSIDGAVGLLKLGPNQLS